jgi:thiamine biosynthesis protein ThiI
VHFHSVPYLDRSSMRKARRLAAVLARGQSATRLHMVAFGEAQSEVVRKVPRSLRVLMYRRLMVKIASRLANRGKAAVLVSGESLGQVASQTMANLAVIEQAAELPLYRPLLGMDKLEITDYARKADTYEISIEPDQDCCTLFVPRHPATRAALEDVLRAEAALDVEALIDSAVEASDYEYIKSDWEQQVQGEGSADSLLAASGLPDVSAEIR